MVELDETRLQQEINIACARIGVNGGLEWPPNFNEAFVQLVFSSYRHHLHIIGREELLEWVLPSLQTVPMLVGRLQD